MTQHSLLSFFLPRFTNDRAELNEGLTGRRSSRRCGTRPYYIPAAKASATHQVSSKRFLVRIDRHNFRGTIRFNKEAGDADFGSAARCIHLGAMLPTCDVSARGQVETIAMGSYAVLVGSGGAQ